MPSRFWIAAILTSVFLFVTLAPGAAQENGEGQPAYHPGLQNLSGVRLGTLPEYTRLIFNFSRPVGAYEVSRSEVNELRLDFGPARTKRQGRLDLDNEMVEGVVTTYRESRLTALVKLKVVRFNFRHFTTPDRLSVIVDFKPTEQDEAKVENVKKEPGPVMAIASPTDIAKAVRRKLPQEPQAGTDLALLAAASDHMIQGDFRTAAGVLETFKAQYPGSPGIEDALYLMGESYFNIDPTNLSPQFLKIIGSYQAAVNDFPGSPLAPRARLMLGRAYLAMDYPSEAAGHFKSIDPQNPDGIESLMGLVYLAEVYLKLGKQRLAETALQEVMAKNPQGNFVLDAYSRLGELYFKDGLYSKANEIFREILNRNQEFYVDHPQVLYYMGEGYYHLKRMDLSRAFLYHSLNLQPDSPMVDVISARLGDTYREEGLDEEAIRIFALTRRRFPGTIGSMIAQMRLADYGALRSLYKPESIFIELEDGSNSATLKLYQDVVDRMKDSPLAQFALFKIGLAYFGQEEYSRAMNVFRRIIEENPDGSLAPEARDMFDKAILAEIKSLRDQEKFIEMISLYERNKSSINDEAWPQIRHQLAGAYAGLGMFQEAVTNLEANKGLTDFEDERLLILGDAYFRMGKNREAADTFETFLKTFPQHEKLPQALVVLGRVERALGETDRAIQHLNLALTRDPSLDADGEIQGMLGELYLKKEQFDLAVTAMQSSLASLQAQPDAKSDVFLTYSRLGQAYANLGRDQDALGALNAALEFMPENPFPETLYLISDAFRRLGRQDKYLELLNVLAKSPDPFWRRVAEQKLRVIDTEDKTSRLIAPAAKAGVSNAQP